MEIEIVKKESGVVHITSDGIFAQDCHLYDSEGTDLIKTLMPSAITIFLQAGQLNEVQIVIQHIRLDIQGNGIVHFKIQGPIGKTLTPTEKTAYKQFFLETIQNLLIENIEIE